MGNECDSGAGGVRMCLVLSRLNFIMSSFSFFSFLRNVIPVQTDNSSSSSPSHVQDPHVSNQLQLANYFTLCFFLFYKAFKTLCLFSYTRCINPFIVNVKQMQWVVQMESVVCSQPSSKLADTLLWFIIHTCVHFPI